MVHLLHLDGAGVGRHRRRGDQVTVRLLREAVQVVRDRRQDREFVQVVRDRRQDREFAQVVRDRHQDREFAQVVRDRHQDREEVGLHGQSRLVLAGSRSKGRCLIVSIGER